MNKQQPLLGFFFALITAIAWGSLSLALREVLLVMNAQTTVFYRFVVASLSLFLLLFFTGKLPKASAFKPGFILLAMIGVVGLSLNFFLFNYSLNYIEPSIAQVLFQISVFAMLICGVFIFKEKMGLHQKIGLVLLIVGLGLFFNDRFDKFINFNAESIGILIGAGASIVWVVYGLAQKVLSRHFTGQQILLMIYFGCAIAFTPFADFGQIFSLKSTALWCFVYCCLNTLIGYGAYAEALNRWDVSKVSVIITLTPLFTILFDNLLYWSFPDKFHQPSLNSLSYLGAIIVVGGAITSAIGYKFIKRGKK